MKMLRLVCFAALCGAASAVAAPPAEIAGTWECRQPGVQYNNKPPILYVSDNPGAPGGPAEVTIEVDGFAREVFGRAELVQDQDGWWKVKPAQGQEFMIRLEPGAKQRTPAMGLRWADSKSDYRCLRLPASAAANRPLSAPPPDAQNAPRPGALSIPPSGEPNQGSEKKE